MKFKSSIMAPMSYSVFVVCSYEEKKPNRSVFSQAHKWTIVYFVFSYICSFLHYLYHLVNVKLKVSGF